MWINNSLIFDATSEDATTDTSTRRFYYQELNLDYIESCFVL